jgi:hypothetical protein
MGMIKNYHDKKWTLQFLDTLYNSIDYNFYSKCLSDYRFKFRAYLLILLCVFAINGM